MIKKMENCLYCGEKMESKTAKKRFCCDLHRVYWNRENKQKVKKEPLKPNLPEPEKQPVYKNELSGFWKKRMADKLGIK